MAAAGEGPPRYRRFHRQICAGSVHDELRLHLPERVITLPQQPGIRSLNMAQCAAVVVFEAVRQQRASHT
jgi:tRNA(Leu) C34 or U34 (ribose-2'-O)-methylase TrmL